MVSGEPITVNVPPDSELGTLLRNAAESGRPVIVITGEAAYSLAVETSIDASDAHIASILARPPTQEQVARSIEGTRKAAGSWKGLVDAEELKAYIRERRRTKNRPPVQL